LVAVILGLIWGSWHMPMYLVHNPEGNRTGVFLIYFIMETIPLAVLFVWLFNTTKGSLMITIFFSAINATFSLFAKLPTGELRPFIYTMGFITLTAVIIVWRTKGRLGIL
jgi:membrane protease YdiL (CAAX protease family)